MIPLSLTTCGQPPTVGRVPESPAPQVTRWFLSWRSETVFPQFTSDMRTCRFPARLAGGGSALRAEFANPAQTGASYSILDASVAEATGDSVNIRPSTAAHLAFAGRRGVVVAPGATVLSDPVSLSTERNTFVAVTVTVGPGAAPTTPNAGDMGACAASPLPASVSGTAPGELFSTPSHLAWLRSIQVNGPATRSIAGFGDSLTASPALPLHSYWTDFLQDHGAAVVNAAVAGGYLTRTGMFGTTAGLRRLDDLLAEPGLSDVVMLMGTNDLGVGVSPDVLLSAFASATRKANAKRVRLWVATIAPRAGSAWPFTAEKARLQVNTTLRSEWLSLSGGRLIDIDAALRDPREPGRMMHAFDSGDHVHPNAAGVRQLGITIGAALGLPM